MFDQTNIAKAMIRHVPLWVMFLACMATSVFFSFDSLFSRIFPQDERQRAATSRIHAELSTLTNDIAETARSSEQDEIKSIFRSEAWIAYAAGIKGLGSELGQFSTEIKTHIGLEAAKQKQTDIDRQRKLSELKQQRNDVLALIATLEQKLIPLNQDATEIQGKVKSIENTLRAKEEKILKIQSDAKSEELGFSESGAAGRGPRYRSLMREVEKIKLDQNNDRDLMEVYLNRAREQRQQIDGVVDEIASEKSMLASLDFEIKQNADEAPISGQAPNALETVVVNAGKERMALDAALRDYQNKPTKLALTSLEQQCASSKELLNAHPVSSNLKTNFDCKASGIHQISGKLYVVQSGAEALVALCKHNKNVTGTIEDGIARARECLATSNLSSKESAPLSQKIASLERNRDDKAHRFVVTMNAFSDGNSLAYLALFIALTIDSLVFASGLFGTGSLRSHLSRLSVDDGISALKREAMIRSALLPNVFQNALTILNNARSVSESGTQEAAADGWTHKISSKHAAHNDAIVVNRFLSIAHAAGVAKPASPDSMDMLLRRELIELLSDLLGNDYVHNKSEFVDHQQQLISTIERFLAPDVAKNTDLLLNFFEPVADVKGYAAVCCMNDIPKRYHAMFRNTLGVASAADALLVRRDHRTKSKQFYVSNEFYMALIQMSSGILKPIGNYIDEPASQTKFAMADMAGANAQVISANEAQLPRDAIQVNIKQPETAPPGPPRFSSQQTQRSKENHLVAKAVPVEPRRRRDTTSSRTNKMKRFDNGREPSAKIEESADQSSENLSEKRMAAVSGDSFSFE